MSSSQSQTGPLHLPRRRSAAAVAGWIVAALAVGALLGSWWGPGRRSPAAEPGGGAFQSLAQRLLPSVVNIQTDAEAPAAMAGGQVLPDAAEGDFAANGGLQPENRTLGSGVIVGPRGYILTNYHVVRRARRIAVWLYHHPQPYPAQLVGSDRATDLALLKIHAGHPLPAVQLDGSRGLRVGDWVLAIGSPFGLDHTVTAGIVSALGRHVAGEDEFQRFIQTDAPINPGNSGGPLVNMAGQVVGINTAIYTVSYAYEGVGFALPAELARNVYRQLLRHGRVRRGSIGIYFQPNLPPAVRKIYGIQRGVPISAVVAGGPAARAGLRAGDVIVAIGGKPVRSGQQLLAAIVRRRVGSRVEVSFRRRGKPMEAAVQVANRDRLFHLAGDFPPPPAAPRDPTLGLELRSVSAAAAAGQRLPRIASGVVVRAVDPGSFAGQIGIRRGDVIVSLDRHPIPNAEVFRALSSQLRPGQPVAMGLRRLGADNQWTQWWAGGLYR